MIARRSFLVVALLLATSTARADFVLGGTSLTTNKTDLFPIPIGVNPLNYISASDYNAVAQASLDLRSAITGGTSGYVLRLADGSSAAVSASGTGALRYNNSTHVFEQSLNGGAWTGLGGATLATTYSNGASQTDETITEDSTRLGPILKGYASQTTSLFTLRQGSTPGANEDPLTVQDSTSTAVARIEIGGLFWANGQTGGYTADTLGGGATKYISWIATNSTAATGGTPVQEAPGFEINSKVWDTGSTTSKASAWHIYSTPVSGNPAYGQFELLHSLAGAADTSALTVSTGSSLPSATTGVAIYGVATSSPTIWSTGGSLKVGAPGGSMTYTSSGGITLSGSLLPDSANLRAVGTVGAETSQVASYRFFGIVQSPTFLATMTLDPTAGETIRVVMTANLGAWNFTNGNTGQTVVVQFIQDATGSRTIGTPPSNVKFAGGTPTLTTTANKRDSFTFRYSSTDSAWYEIARALNE